MELISFSDCVNVKPAEDADATSLEPESEHHYTQIFFQTNEDVTQIYSSST